MQIGVTVRMRRDDREWPVEQEKDSVRMMSCVGEGRIKDALNLADQMLMRTQKEEQGWR